MFATIIETIVGALAEYFSGKAAEKGLEKAGRARGWIALGMLAALFAFLIWLGIYLIGAGAWPVGLLMLAIAGLIAYITAMPVLRKRRGKGAKDGE